MKGHTSKFISGL